RQARRARQADYKLKVPIKILTDAGLAVNQNSGSVHGKPELHLFKKYNRCRACHEVMPLHLFKKYNRCRACHEVMPLHLLRGPIV
ncbi:MAG: hypothetical protein AAB766_02545, partial [Patescibacteria group bacterium]